MADILYTVEKQCPVCSGTFSATRMRSRLSMLKQDSDFCTYYKEANPNYYTIWVCPTCGYAAQDTYFEETPAAVHSIRSFLAARKVNVNFAGERTCEQAIATYKLAIFFAEMGGIISSRLASLYLKLAWLYREAEQSAEELVVLDKARIHYEQAFLTENTPFGNMTQLTLEYLIGELFRRTGQLPQALNYLGKVVANPQAKQEKRILEMAREAWHKARAKNSAE